MSKVLEDYKTQVIIKEINEETEKATARGFDAAIALELPVKFATWKKNHPFDMKNRVLWMDIVAKVGHNSPSIPELYIYWIKNIFKIE